MALRMSSADLIQQVLLNITRYFLDLVENYNFSALKQNGILLYGSEQVKCDSKLPFKIGNYIVTLQG